jgi:hypothetical protein
MKPARTHLLGKFLEAVGIAASMLSLVQGIHGDMWGELYFLIGGIVAFFIGFWLAKKKDLAKSNIDLRDTNYNDTHNEKERHV